MPPGFKRAELKHRYDVPRIQEDEWHSFSGLLTNKIVSGAIAQFAAASQIRAPWRVFAALLSSLEQNKSTERSALKGGVWPSKRYLQAGRRGWLSLRQLRLEAARGLII